MENQTPELKKREPKPIPWKEFYTNNHSGEPFEQALAQCKAEGDIESAKVVIRGHRNRLLEASDARMSLDRLGLTTPTYTLAGLIEFIRTLVRGLTGGWAKYRQALRDIPDQPGFPFDVVWPAEPLEEENNDQ